MKENPIRDRSYAFALEVVRFHDRLPPAARGVLGRQMLRSGTSVGANVEEAVGAQSRRDFVAKLSIARKEARECLYWLRLLRDSGGTTAEAVRPVVEEASSLLRMLTSIILSSQTPRPPSETPPRNP